MVTPKSRRAKGDLTPKGERTRRHIVETAARLMFTGGVAGTTVEQVRDAAGVSSSQVYHYFADKQSLIRAVIDYQTETVVGPQEPLFERIDGIAGLREWRDHIVTLQQRRGCRGGCPIGSLGSELAEIDQDARTAIAAGFERWETAIRGCLRTMHERGDLRPGTDPDELATATLAALQGGLLLTQFRRDTRPLETTLDVLLTLIESTMVGSAARHGRAGTHGT